MRPYTIARCMLLAGLCLLPWACSEDRGVSGTLPPGEMELVSVTPVEAGTGSNLLLNGDFAEWWAGAPAPTAFQAPAPTLSVIERISDQRVDGFAVTQRWRKPDRRQRNSLCFQTEVNLQPNTQYTLQVAASTNDEHRAPTIFVLERKADGGYENLAVPLLSLESYPDLFRWYEGSFATKQGDRVTILVKTQGEDEAIDTPTVTWHDWKLYKTTDAPVLPADSARTVLFGVSAPKIPDGGIIQLGPGENLEINGWIVGGVDARVQYQLNGEAGREAELVPRSDVAEKYPHAPVKTGWKIAVENQELPAEAVITLQFDTEKTLSYKIQKSS